MPSPDELKKTAPVPPALPAPSNLRVLVVDDEEPIRRVVKAILRETGALVETAADGREALHILLHRDFDVALVDLRMKDMGGAQFLTEARAVWPWLGIVIMTGYADDESIAHAHRHGVTHILGKPLQADILRQNVIEEAMAKRHTVELSASHGLDQIQQQLTVLRQFSEAALAAENIDAALFKMSTGIGALIPCSVVGILGMESDKPVIYLNVLKPVTQAFLASTEENMLARYEALSGKPRPTQSLRIHADSPHLTADGPTAVTRTFNVPIIMQGEVRGLMTLALSSQDDQAVGNTPFLYHAANSLSTVLSALSRMRQLSIRDPMTGVYNRKGLEEEYQRAWMLGRRYGYPVGVAIIDIDHFKSLNDTHGHPAGDQVLREFSELIRRVARGSDIVGRYGGDEMVVILPQASAADVIAFGERLLSAVHAYIFIEKTLNLSLTASVGVTSSQASDPDETPERLMIRADQGLYRAKRAGRDRVVLQQVDSEVAPSEAPAPVTPPGQRLPSLREGEVKGRILVVDDEPSVCTLFSRILKKQNFEVAVENSATAAIARLKKDSSQFDILLTDLSMPDKSGLELLDELRSIDELLIKIVITGNATLDNAITSLRRGAYDFIEKPVVADQLVAVVERALEYGRLKAENRRYQLHLEDMVREKSAALREALDQIRHSYDFTLEAMVAMLDARERSTGQHSVRVRQLAGILAREMKLSPNEVEDICKGALLHDIGKIAIPDAILLKPGKLTAEEWEVMRTHAAVGFKILQSSGYLERASDIVHCHHESYDGSGYPRGLKGEEICLGARIFSVVDAYDAMRSHRVYRASIPPDEAAAEIIRFSGRQFDPAVVEVFKRCQTEFERVGNWE